MLHQDIENYHQFLNGEYEEVKRVGSQKLLSEGIVPPRTRVMEDRRRSLALVYPLPYSPEQSLYAEVLTPLDKLFQELHSPQVVFGPDWLHTTALVIMANETTPPFDPEKEDVTPYAQLAREVLSDHHHFGVSFRRIATFPGEPGGVLLGGFPNTLEVDKVREELIQELNRRNLRSYKLRLPQIFQTTVTRWDSRLEPEKTGRILDFLDSLDNREVWSGQLNQIHLVNSGGYNASPANTKLIAAFNLS